MTEITASETFAVLGVEAHTGGLLGGLRSMILTVTQYLWPGARLLRGSFPNPSLSTVNVINGFEWGIGCIR